MKIVIPLYNGNQIVCDSLEEAEALKWLATVSPYTISQCNSLWEYYKKKYPKDSWERILERVAFVLYNCAQTNTSVYRILEIMLRFDELGRPTWGTLNL